jgi:hypothetical protein
MEGGRASLNGTPPLDRRPTLPPRAERPRTVWRSGLRVYADPLDGMRRRTLAKAGSYQPR